MATSGFGSAQERAWRAGERAESEGRVRESRGGLRGVSRGHGSKHGGRRWRAAAVRASGTRCASDWREEEDLPAPGGLGQPDGLPGGLRYVGGQVSRLLFF